jgi:hypothetical protein
MRRTLICLLLAICSAQADVLFRDEGQGHGYSFESDEKNVEDTVTRDEVIELASDWAASFYEDDSLEFADIQTRIEPIRFWLVTFKKTGTGEVFYAVVLPDGTIVEPQDETRV